MLLIEVKVLIFLIFITIMLVALICKAVAMARRTGLTGLLLLLTLQLQPDHVTRMQRHQDAAAYLHCCI